MTDEKPLTGFTLWIGSRTARSSWICRASHRRTGLAELLNALGVLIDAALMQDQLGYVTGAVTHEGDFGIDTFYKILAIGFCENFNLGLAGRLREEMIAFASDGQDEIRREFVASDVVVENFWGN